MSTNAMYPEIVGEIGNGPDGWGKHAARIEALSTLDLMEHARKVIECHKSVDPSLYSTPNGCGMQDCPRHFTTRDATGDFYTHMGEPCLYPRLKAAVHEEVRQAILHARKVTP